MSSDSGGGFSREVLLAAVRECVTIVGPGEVLAIRVSPDLDEEEIGWYGERAAAVFAETGVRAIVIACEEFARMQPGQVP